MAREPKSRALEYSHFYLEQKPRQGLPLPVSAHSSADGELWQSKCQGLMVYNLTSQHSIRISFSLEITLIKLKRHTDQLKEGKSLKVVKHKDVTSNSGCPEATRLGYTLRKLPFVLSTVSSPSFSVYCCPLSKAGYWVKWMHTHSYTPQLIGYFFPSNTIPPAVHTQELSHLALFYYFFPSFHYSLCHFN